MWKLRAMALWYVTASACGSAGIVISCDHRAAAVPRQQCDQWNDVPASEVTAVEQNCDGALSMQGCPKTGSLGGCRTCEDAGVAPETWFYPDPSNGFAGSEDVRLICTSQTSSCFDAP